MSEPKIARYVSMATLYVAAAVILAEGLGSEKEFLKATSWIPAAIMVAFTVYERWLWRIGFFGRLPVLSGTWKANLVSTWTEDPDAPTPPQQRTVYFVFRQTATLLTVTMHTELSGSQTLASQLQREADGTYRLSWIYQNVSLEDETKSPAHVGSVIAERVGGRRVTEIRGKYFTDRKTTGGFSTVGERKRERATSLAEAKKLFGDT